MLRIVKIALGVGMLLLTIAGIVVAFAIPDFQKPQQWLARDDTLRAFSQAEAEFSRFKHGVAAFAVAGSGIDQDDVRRRFEALGERLDMLRHGDAKAFTDAVPDGRAIVEAYRDLLAALDPLVQTVNRPGAVERILALCQPFDARLTHLAASAGAYFAREAAADRRSLARLYELFFAIAAALAACGLALLAFVSFETRRLARDNMDLRAAADDLRTAKTAADSASEAKSRFLATMSHELRTPLNAVIGFSEIISEETFGPVGQQVYRGYANDIMRSGHHMLDLINDILTMAKLDAGRYEVDPVPVDLREGVERAVNMFRGTKQAEGRSIAVAAEGGWPWIEADERAIRQMLLNLLSNAAKFSEPGTPLEVYCQTLPDGDVVIAVTDHGIGMTPQEAAQAIRPFSQVDSRLARKYEGSGLGLSIVSGLMACHGGSLVIDSQPGIGSRMSLVFPARLVCTNTLPAVA